MSENNVKLNKVRLIGVHIDMAREMSKALELKIECKAKIKFPNGLEETKIMLEVELSIVSHKNDDLKITLLADSLFEVDSVPNDYNEIVAEKCIPLVRDDLFNSLDTLLVGMGYNKLNLVEKAL